MGRLTERGEAVSAGYNALTDDLPGAPDISSDAEVETPDPEQTSDAAPADPAPEPGPADIPPPPEMDPTIETADDPAAAGRETRDE